MQMFYEGEQVSMFAPRFMCWENVPGAFSSGQQKGDDFRVVLEETLGIGVSGIHVPENHPWGW